ncbi:MAG: amidohydrolase [Bacteroidales bacterium]|nr:amidohydrolase [Bacteroidales bacterium]
MDIIDAHTHLWLRQTAKDVVPMPDGRAMFFGEERQMLPPFMRDGVNSAEILLANMNYARVGGAVVVQEVIDGNQDGYLAEVQKKYPQRLFCCALKDLDHDDLASVPDGFKGVAVPGHRAERNLTDPEVMEFFKLVESRGLILSMCLADDASQIARMREVIQECPAMKVAIGHFGMVTGKHWMEQVELASYRNVFVEAGGITWLFNHEFYPYPGAVKAVREAADRVGIEKLMWGSDYPRTICAITYKMSYDFFQKSGLLSEEEKVAFLGGNAAGFYGFDALPELPYVKNMSE